jgi:hypothetical protein
MKINEGKTDRILRIVAGLILIGLTATGYLSVWGWIGLVLLGTGALGWCPLYAALGFSTCPVKR